MSGKSQNDFVFMILFVVLNLQTCCGNYDCFWLSSGKDICFMFDGFERTFEDSKTYCRNKGGFLLEITNEEIQRIVEQYGTNKLISFVHAWLNLVQRYPNMWFWGGEQSGYSLTYSNWEPGSPASIDSQGTNIAYLVSSYKWSNTYKHPTASTICIEAQESFLPDTTTKSTTSTTTTTTEVIPPIAPPAPPATTSTTTTLTTKTTTTTTTTTTSTKSSSPSTTKTATTTTNPNSGPTQTTTSSYGTMTNTSNNTSSSSPSSSAAAVGIGVGVVLGGLVLIVASSLLIAKFVFHKEIPLPFKSSRSTKSPPHQTGSDVINEVYEQVEESKAHDDQNTKSIKDDLSSESSPPTCNNIEYKDNISAFNYMSLCHLDQDSNVYQTLRPSRAT